MKQTRILPCAPLIVLLASLLSTGCGSSSSSAANVTIASPTFSPAGGAYTSVQTVTISDATPGATIYYTCSGPGLSLPCVNTNAIPTPAPPPSQAGAFLGTLYTGPITVSGTETINAIATYLNAPFSPSVSATYTLPLLPPTFSLAAGTYSSFQTVTIADALPGATIYYTTDGSTPAAGIGTTLPYTKPIAVSSTETINAIAVATSYANSAVSTAAYTINLGTAATPTISPASGTYTSIQTVTIADATPGVAINYSVNGGVPVLYTAPFQVSATTTISATASETGYYLTSPVAAAAYTINLPPAPTPTFTPTAGTYTSIQTVAVADSVVGASIYYTTNGSAPTTASNLYASPITVSTTETINAIAIAISSGYSQSAVGTAAYTLNLPAAATPTFTPAAGTYNTAQTVTIADSLAGASIYYTINGNTPTTSSTPYTVPITVSGTEVIKAIAIATGYSASAVGSAAYTLNLPPTATPTFSPAAGTYSGPQTITISDTATGAVFYYTLDGSTPTTASTQYTVPITVSQPETISAIALAPGFGNSAVATAAYTITYSLSGNVLTGTQAVTGSSVQVYASGTGGYGLGSTSISTVGTTDSNGHFTLQYACPSISSQIYLVANGGNPGLVSGTNNAYLALMTALGQCGVVSASSPAVIVNEVTTVASVWSLQQFMASPTVATTQGVPIVGTVAATYNGVSTGIVGLQNAFGMVNNMVNVLTGSAATPTNSWSTAETTKINTIADILAYCNSTNPSTTTSCATLMTDATPASKAKAIDTIQAAWYMAQNPGNNVSNLYKLVSTSATNPFPPITPVATPNDWTLAVNLAPTYTPASTAVFAVNTPHHVAIDAYGNVWLSNNGSLSNTTGAPAGVVELAPNGKVIMNPVKTFTASTTGGAYSQFTTKPSSNSITYTKPKMLAIDTSNNVWVANWGTTSGTPAAGTIGTLSGSTGVGIGGGATLGGYYVGGAPWGIAVDGHNNIYESNMATTGMDPQSIGKLVGSTGTYTYSTSGSNTAPNQIPNLTIATGNGSQLTWSAVLAVDTNTTASGGADGILWLVSPACLVGSSQYDVVAGVPTPVAWGVIDMFDADTLSALSGSEATTSFSGASTGPGSTTNCGSTTQPGTGLQINQLFSAAMAVPFGIAIDKNNGVWIADNYDSSGGNYNMPGFNGLTYLAAPTTSTGVIPSSTYITNNSGNAPLSATATPGQGSIIREPAYLEVDGNNNVWAANTGGNYITEASYSYNSTTSTGTITYIDNALSFESWAHTMASASGLAIDPSGNVWVTNTNTNATITYTGQAGNTITTGFSLTVLVGAAGPVVTPLSQAVQSNMLGQKP